MKLRVNSAVPMTMANPSRASPKNGPANSVRQILKIDSIFDGYPLDLEAHVQYPGRNSRIF